MLNKLTALLVPFALAGCIAQSDIQAQYMSQESNCHSEAESRVSSESDPAADRAFVAGTAFSECMNKSGWKVATPKPPKGTTTASNGTPPIGPSTSGGVPGGSASGAAARPAAPVKPTPGQAAQDASTTPAAPVLGPGVQPAPAPAAEAVRNSSTYQPVTPARSLPPSGVYQPSTPTPSYSSPGYSGPGAGSAGRNF